MGSENKKGQGERTLALILLRGIALGLLAAVIVGAYSYTLPDEYSASSLLLFSPLPISADSDGVPQNDPSAQLNFLMAKSLSIPDYRVLLSNPEVVAHLRERWEQLKAPSREDQKPITFNTARDAMEVITRISEHTAYGVAYEPVLELKFTADRPNIAAELANEWAEKGMNLATEINRMREEGMLDFLDEQLEMQRQELKGADETLESLEGELTLDNWQKRIEILDEQVSTFQSTSATLTTEIARDEAALDQLVETLDSLPPTITLRRAIPEEAYWLLEGEGKDVDAADVFEAQEINPAYEEVIVEKVTTAAALEGKRAEKTAIDGEILRLQSFLESLQVRVAEHRRKHTAISRELVTIEEQYKQLSLNYGAARLAEAKNVPDLKLLSRAVPPESRSGPQRTLMALSAGFLGFIVAPLHSGAMRLINGLPPYVSDGNEG